MADRKLRQAVIFFKEDRAGIIEQIDSGYRFTYNPEFIKKNLPISVSLPLDNTVYESEDLFPFFQGLLPEGWYLDLVSKVLKIDKNDSFGILLGTCKDTIGAVSVQEIK